MAHLVEKCLPKSQLVFLLTCPVCMDIFKDPYELPCGHSLCMECLKGMLECRLPMQPFCCPNCREDFGPRFGVSKGYTLHHLAEDYSKRFQKMKDNNTISHKKETQEQSTQTCQVEKPQEQSTQTCQVEKPRWDFDKKLMCLLLVSVLAIYYAVRCSKEWHTFTETVHKQHELLMKHDLYITDLTLNKDTANPLLHVSDDLLTVKRRERQQYYPRHHSRFMKEPQVLSNECVSHGRHFWELEAEGIWDIAVAYKEITRESSRTFGDNRLSWSVSHLGDGRVFAYHAGVEENIDESLTPSWTYNRISVVVDFHIGLITFSEVGDKWRHLYTFKANLKRPVCLGLGLYSGPLPSIVTVKQ